MDLRKDAALIAEYIQWEALTAKFQDVDAAGDPSGKWRVMEKIFQLR